MGGSIKQFDVLPGNPFLVHTMLATDIDPAGCTHDVCTAWHPGGLGGVCPSGLNQHEWATAIANDMDIACAANAPILLRLVVGGRY